MKSKTNIPLKIICVLLLFPVQVFSEEKIKIGLLTYPPYTIENDKGLGGMVIDVLKYVENIENIEILNLPPAQSFNEFRAGKIDFLFSSDISQNNTFIDSNDFIHLFNGDTYLFYNANSININKKLVVGVIRGVDFEKKHLINLGYKTIEIDSPTEGLKMLLENRLDYLHMSKLPIQYILNNNNDFKETKRQIKWKSKKTFQVKVGLFCKKEGRQSVEKLKAKLLSAVKNKKLMLDVINKYYPLGLLSKYEMLPYYEFE